MSIHADYFFKDSEQMVLAVDVVIRRQNLTSFWCDTTLNSITGLEFKIDASDVYTKELLKSTGAWLDVRKSPWAVLDGPMHLKNLVSNDPKSSYKTIYLRDSDLHYLHANGLVESDTIAAPTLPPEPLPSTTTTPVKLTGNKMTTSLKQTAAATLESNKAGGILALKVAVGKAANRTAVRAIKGKLPMMARGYADTPLGALVVANLAQVAVHQFASTNLKAATVADAMVQAAMLDVVNMIDIDTLMDGILDKVSDTKIDDLIKATEESK